MNARADTTTVTNLQMLFRTVIFTLLTSLVFASEVQDGSASEQFPDPLTLDNFKTRTQHGLHLVEFFSPYCSHCKTFAPTWEKTWEEFHEEGESLGIGMAQVDCVASGDLCNQEKITAYPSLKLYGANGFIKDFPRSYKRNQESLVRFMRDIAIDLADPNFLIESKSKFISADAMIKVLGETQKKPQLISFWPSSSLEDLNQFNREYFDGASSPDDVLDFQRTWAIVSNQVIPYGIETGHFNCLSNRQICSKLELSFKKPSVLLILPNTNVAKVIEFDQGIYQMTYKEITEFARRVSENAQAPMINSYDLLEKGLAKTRMSRMGDFPSASEWNFVYVYDTETTTPEDLQLLPYLVEPMSKLPNTHLFKSNDTSVVKVAGIQKTNIYRHFASEEGQEKRTPNEQRILLETMTSLPTLVAFNDNMMTPKVFQNFAPNEIRDQFRVIDWLNEVAGFPVYQEITPTSYKRFMKSGDLSSKLAILLVDKSDPADSLKYQDALLASIHDYNDLRDELRYQNILKKRQLKNEKVLELKEKDAESKLIVRAMSEEVKYDKFSDVVIGYLDVKENLELLNRMGLDVHEREFASGDLVILDRSNSLYYEKDLSGELLNVRESYKPLRDALCVVNGVNPGKLSKRLRNSPYPSWLQFMDSFHQHGLKAYVFVAVVAFAVYKTVPAQLQKHRKLQKRDSLGILGNPLSKYE